MPPKPRPVQDRFNESVDRSAGPDACWPWMKARNEHGYGIMRVAGRNVRAHRIALFPDGEIPGPEVKARHSCDNPPCCNPAHLLVGTQADNVADMHERGRRIYHRKPRAEVVRKEPAGRFSHTTHCTHGHEFSDENTWWKRNPRVRSGFERVCITCRKRLNQEQAARRKAARAARKDR